MLTSEEVHHIATLCRIALKSEEQERMRKELSSILDYVGKLQEVPTQDVEPTSQVTGLVNINREDAMAPCSTESHALLLSNMPQKTDHLLKVRGVFEGG